MKKAVIEETNMAQKYLDVAGVIFVVIGADQRIRVINKKGYAVLNCEGEDITGLNWFDTFIPKRIRDESKGVFEKLIKGELVPVEYYENPVLTRNGEERIIAWHNTLLTDKYGKIYATLSSGEDITERKNAEDKLKKAYHELEAAQNASLNIMEDIERERGKLESSLKERDVLLRELHHRVKNNMQIMSSLMRLQARTITDSHYSGMFKDALNRITAMSLVHEKLYGSEDMGRIGFRDYIRRLAEDLFQTYGITEGRISLKTNIEAPDIDIDKAIPLGLIINELITNSIKYAFPGDRTGEIRITVRPVSENELELLVTDNGIGIPGALDVRNTKTLGMQLVTTLTEDQLKGSIEINRDKGTEFRIKFKIR